MMRIVLRSQNSHQQSQWEQESRRAEGLGCPSIGVPVAGPAWGFHIIVWNGDVVWFSADLLWIAYLTDTKDWFHLRLIKDQGMVSSEGVPTLTHHHCGFIWPFTFHVQQETSQKKPCDQSSVAMALQLSNISMPHFVFQWTNQLSKLY